MTDVLIDDNNLVLVSSKTWPSERFQIPINLKWKSSFSVWNPINEDLSVMCRPRQAGEWVECTGVYRGVTTLSADLGAGDSVTGGSFLLRHQTRRSRLRRSWKREREEPPTSRNLPVFIEQGMFCHQLGWAPRAGRSWRESESERSRGILIWTNTITTQTKWHFFWTISIEVWLLHSKMLFASV